MQVTALQTINSTLSSTLSGNEGKKLAPEQLELFNMDEHAKFIDGIRSQTVQIDSAEKSLKEAIKKLTNIKLAQIGGAIEGGKLVALQDQINELIEEVKKRQEKIKQLEESNQKQELQFESSLSKT